MKSTFLFLVSGLCLAFTPVSKQHTFQFKLDSGKVYSQTTSISTDSKQSLSGQEMTAHQFVAVTTSLEYNEQKDSLDNYTMWYDEFSMEVQGMGMNQKFTSDTTALASVDATSRILNQLVDKKFNADFATNGQIIEVFGLEEIITEATISSTGLGNMYAEQFSAGFGDSGLAKNLELVTAIWPETEVKIGDSWTNEQYTSTGLPIILKNTYTLVSIDKKIGQLSVSSTAETDKNNNSTEMSGMNAVYYLEGNRSGTIDFEIETGWVTNANFDDLILGNIVLAPSEQLPEGMTIPVEFKNKITVKAN